MFKRIKRNDQEKIRIIPFGGCGEFGMNTTGYCLGGKMIIVDAGLMFPQPKDLGVGAIIPMMGPAFERVGDVSAWIITHGHEDHIGAMPYMMKRWPAPVYATPWTRELLKKKFERHGIPLHYIKTVKPGETIKVGPFAIEYVHVNHSIPDACALFIKSKGGNVFHTADFKFDFTPIGTQPIDIKKLEGISRQGVDLLLADSTNALSPGMGPSERSVIKPLSRIIRSHPGRVVVTTFASNFWRLLALMEVAKLTDRQLVVSGRGLVDCFEIGMRLGYCQKTKNLIMDDSKLNKLDPKKTLVIVSGSQGESRSAMSRIASGEHKAVRVKEDDLFIFSSRIIPGNERSVLEVIDRLERQGGKVVTTKDNPSIHVSGHAYQGELSYLIELLKPKHYLPIHGTYIHMNSNRKLSEHVPARVIENGDVIELSRNHVTIDHELDMMHEFVDQDSSIPMTYDTLKERLRIGELGLAVVSGVYSRGTSQWLKDPEIELVGLRLNERDNYAKWTREIVRKIKNELSGLLGQRQLNEKALQDQSSAILRRELTSYFQKKPAVISKICLV